MVTCWLLIDTIAMMGSPASRGAVASVGTVGRALFAAASAGAAAVSAVNAAAAARVTMAEAPHRPAATVDCAVVNRFVIPAPVQMYPRGAREGARRNKRLGTGGWFPFYAPRSINTSARAARDDIAGTEFGCGPSRSWRDVSLESPQCRRKPTLIGSLLHPIHDTRPSPSHIDLRSLHLLAEIGGH